MAAITANVGSRRSNANCSSSRKPATFQDATATITTACTRSDFGRTSVIER